MTGVDEYMGKWTDTLFGTSEEQTKKHKNRQQRKNELRQQKENNEKLRTYYRNRHQEELRLRKIRDTEKKQ